MEVNSTTKLYDLPFRNYDAALGSFFQVDALALSDHASSTFAYAGNNPIVFNDPSGLTKADPNGFKSADYWAKYDAAMQGIYIPWWDDFAEMAGGGGGGPGSGSYQPVTETKYSVSLEYQLRPGQWNETSWKWIPNTFASGNPDDNSGLSLIINFMPNAQEHYKGMNWVNVTTNSVKGAETIVNNLAAKGFHIKNLVLVSHASGDALILGPNDEDRITVNDIVGRTAKVKTFNAILSSVMKGGAIVIVGCGAGSQIGPLLDAPGNQVHLYMNTNLSHGDFHMGPDGNTLLPYFNMDKGLSEPGSPGEWVDYGNSDSPMFFSNLIVKTNGTVQPVK